MTGPQHTLPVPDLSSLVPGWLREPLTGDVDAGRRPRSVRDWVVDVACVLGSLASGGAVLLWWEHSSLVPVPAEAVVLVGFSALLWWRRRWPVACALVALPGLALTSTLLPCWHVLFFTVAVHRRVRLVAPVGVLYLAASVAIRHVLGGDRSALWEEPHRTTLLVAAAAAASGLLVQVRRRSARVWRDRAARARQQREQQMDQARRLERTRIAREMHDVLGHRLSLLSVHAGALEIRPDADPAQITAAAGVIRDNAHQAMQELREVMGVLSETGSDRGGTGSEHPQPGLEAIPELIAESTRSGARIRYRNDLPDLATTGDDPVTPTIARTVYRVVQEGLTNARKHAPGAVIDVSLTVQGDDVVVEVANPLPLQPPRRQIPGSGVGLVGLGERVQLAGGRLTHRVTPEGTFVLHALIHRRRKV